MLAIPSLLRMPPELLSEVMPTVETTLKSNILSMGDKIYYQTVCAIQPTYYLRSKETYQNIIRDLAAQYPNYSKKLLFLDLIDIMNQFTRLRVFNT